MAAPPQLRLAGDGRHRGLVCPQARCSPPQTLRSPALPLHSARPLLVVSRHDAPGGPGGRAKVRAESGTGPFLLAARGSRRGARLQGPGCASLGPESAGLGGPGGGACPHVRVSVWWWGGNGAVLSESARLRLSSSPSPASLVTGSPPAEARPSFRR